MGVRRRPQLHPLDPGRRGAPASSCGWWTTSAAAQRGPPTSPRRSSHLVGRESAGIVHVTGDGEPCTWADLAEVVVGHPVERISTAEFGAPAPRPPSSVLDLGRARALGVPLADWRGSVRRYLEEELVKGVVLAGGLGTRLAPMTTVVNKHVLDLFDEPMIHFPVRTLAQAGVTDLVVVVGRHGDQIRELLGDGANLGVSIAYAHQEGEAGSPMRWPRRAISSAAARSS